VTFGWVASLRILSLSCLIILTTWGLDLPVPSFFPSLFLYMADWSFSFQYFSTKLLSMSSTYTYWSFDSLYPFHLILYCLFPILGSVLNSTTFSTSYLPFSTGPGCPSFLVGNLLSSFG